MRGFGVLLKKEIKEQLRTYRLVVVAMVFLLLGLTTPVTLKFMPEIIKWAGQGIQVNTPTPTAADSLVGYAGDVSQIGVLVVVLVAMGMVANELQRGTAVIILSKPVTRAAFVASKLAAVSLTIIVSLAAASVLCLGYTVWLIGPADAVAFLGLNLLVACFLVFCLSVTLLFSSIFRSSLAAGGVALGTVVGQALLSALPWVGDYLPGRLLGWGNAMVTAGSKPYWPALAVTVALIVVCVYLAQRVLKGKEV